jgi:hypothetical protein
LSSFSLSLSLGFKLHEPIASLLSVSSPFGDLDLIEPDKFLIRQQAAYENGKKIGGLAR